MAFGSFGSRTASARSRTASGERITVPVLEGGRAFRPGAPTELEPGGPAGTFGIRDLGGRIRIVWRFQASDETRTFTIRYRFAGLAVGYDDVVDVNLKVWGDEWEQPLGRLTATTSGPGDVVRAWGHPVWVRGDVTLAGPRALLRALDVPAGQFVELRALYPRGAFSSTAGMRVEDGPGLAKIVAEEQADAEEYAKDQERIDELKDNPLRTGLVVLALATLPALVVIAAVFWFFGRERRTRTTGSTSRSRRPTPSPRSCPTLLRQGGEAGSYEFTATLFDLIRRGVYKATPATTERKIWAGLRTQTVSDLELSAGEEPTLRPGSTMSQTSSTPCWTAAPSGFRTSASASRTSGTSMSERFESFKGGSRHGRPIDEAGSARSARSRSSAPRSLFALVGALLLFLAAGRLALRLSALLRRRARRRRHRLLVNAALLGATRRVRPAPVAQAVAAGQTEAERWDAFRRYLTDFPRLQEAPPATLALWERYLVYGIAFGIAERVLQGAQIHMPEALHQASTIYWISPSGDLGSGVTSLSIGDLPPASEARWRRRTRARWRRRRLLGRRRWRRRRRRGRVRLVETVSTAILRRAPSS